MDSLTLSVSGMTCPKCVSKVQIALEDVDDVMDAEIDLDAAQVTVELAADAEPEAAKEAVVEAITEAGYGVNP